MDGCIDDNDRCDDDNGDDKDKDDDDNGDDNDKSGDDNGDDNVKYNDDNKDDNDKDDDDNGDDNDTDDESEYQSDEDNGDNDGDINVQIFWAIRQNKEETVLKLLQDGADPNYRTSNIMDGKAGFLHSSVRGKSYNITKLLLEHGAFVDLEDEDGDTPLFSAVYKDIPVDIQTLLISHGANVNHRNKCGITPLAKMLQDGMYWGFKFSEHTLLDLLASCNDFHQLTTNGMSLIHLVSTVHSCTESNSSAEHICVVFLNKLIQNGVSVNLLDPLGRTALHSVSSVCCFQGIQFLLDNGIMVDTKDIKGQMALHQIGNHPIGNEFEKSLDLLIKHRCDINETDTFLRTVLHYVTSSQNTNRKAVEMLHKRGALLDVRDKAILSPLHLSVLPTVNVSYTEAEDEYPSKSDVDGVISYLVENGVDVDGLDSSGRTALHLAVRERDTAIVKHLIKLGADINRRTKTGETVLHRATIDEATFNAVLDASDASAINENAQDNFGSTALHWAVGYLKSHVIKKLKSLGANFNINDHQGKTAADIALDLRFTNVYDDLGIVYHRKLYPLQQEETENPLLRLLQGNGNVPMKVSVVYSEEGPRTGCSETESNSTTFSSDNSNEESGDSMDVFDESDEEQCSGKDYIYPDCPLLRTIYNENRSINIIPWVTHLQEHKAALKSFVHFLVHRAPENMALFQTTPDNDDIVVAVRDLLTNVSRQISSENPIFECKIFLAGSWNEGTKTTSPDEFDYNFRLINFDEPFVVEESTTTHGEFVRFRLKEEAIYKNFSRFVDNNGYLDGRKVIREFYTIFNDVLSRGDLPCHESLYIIKYLKIDKGSISKLAFRWVGHVYKDLLIEVDIVPSILPKNFTPTHIHLDSRLIQKIDKDNEIDVVLKTPNERFVPDWNTYFRISVAKLEAGIIKSLPEPVRKGFSLVKALRDTLYMPQVHDSVEDGLIPTMLSTYILKTCFLHVLEAALASSDASLNPTTDDSSTKVTVAWARRIMTFFRESLERNSLPAFFVSGVNLFLHESTSVCNDMYIREAEMSCLTELVSVGTENLFKG